MSETLLVMVLPIVLIVAGIVIWYRRGVHNRKGTDCFMRKKQWIILVIALAAIVAASAGLNGYQKKQDQKAAQQEEDEKSMHCSLHQMMYRNLL